MFYNYTFDNHDTFMISEFATQPDKVVDAKREFKYFGKGTHDCVVTLEFKKVGMYGDRFIGKWKVKKVLVVF